VVWLAFRPLHSMAGLNIHHRRFVNPHNNHEKLKQAASLVFESQYVQPSAIMNFNRHFEENESLVEMERPAKRRRIENNAKESADIRMQYMIACRRALIDLCSFPAGVVGFISSYIDFGAARCYQKV
jgi:hypothetical protein